MTDALREAVRARYAQAARHVTDGRMHGAACGCGQSGSPSGSEGCCAPFGQDLADRSGSLSVVQDTCCGSGAALGEGFGATAGEGFGALLYDPSEREGLPQAAVLARLGCGNPTAVAELKAGDTVLDLGSGGGIDVLLSAGRVGPTGTAYGVDMTDEMLELAERNRAEAGVSNAIFLKGQIEDVPLPDASIDVIISNCVVDLSTDKPRVFAEMARLLRRGGRIGLSDVVADDSLTPGQRAERGSFVGCIAGALSVDEYRTALQAAGFGDISVTSTHRVGDGMYSAIVRAVRPD